MSSGLAVGAGRTPEQIAAVLYDGERPPTPEQSRVTAAGLDPVLVVAGAGSGKTETMAMRVLWLLDNHPDLLPDQVLCLTFTRKAAGEIADRVRERLATLRRTDEALRSDETLATDELAGGTVLGASPEDVLGLSIGEPTMATYNSYAASLVREHGLRLGVDPDSAVLSEAGQWQLASEVVESWVGDLDVTWAASTVTRAVIDLAGACNEHLIDPHDVREFLTELLADLEALPRDDRSTGPGKPYANLAKPLASLRQRAQLVDMVEGYVRRKRERGVLDFGDQVAIAARLAQLEPVRAAERDRFRVVLLDEYQDTSVAQLALLSALFGDGHPVTAVGDPNQAIYGWRGASAGGLERFPDMFRRADGTPAEQMTLSIAWRNPPEVLDVANQIAAPLRAASAVDVPELQPAPGAGPTRSFRDADAPVRAVFTATLEDESRAVAEFLREHWWAPNQRSAREPLTAAVLCRTRAQFAPIVEQLRAAGFDPEVVGLGGLLDTPELVDLIAALEVVHDPSRGDSLMRLLTGHRMRLGAADLLALADWAAALARRTAARPADPDAAVEPDVVDERSIVDALDDLPPEGWTSPDGRSLSPAGRARLVELAEILHVLRSQTALPIPELIASAERLLGLDIELMARPGVAAWRARQHLDELADVAHEFLATTDRPTLGAFLAWLDAAREQERGLEIPTADPVPGGLQVLTVHAAKGLEWDVVAIPGMVDGILPSGRAPKDPAAPMKASGWLTESGELPYPLRGDRDHLPQWAYTAAGTQKDLRDLTEEFRVACGAHELAEERRLAYVAVTRTKRRLLMSGSWWRTSTEQARPSVFLRELVAAGLISDAAWAAPPADGTENPALSTTRTEVWPPEHPDATGHTPLAAAADAVRAAMARLPADSRDAAPSTTPTRPARGAGAVDWVHEARLLLEEQRNAHRPPQVELPEHLSASAMVELAADPVRFARTLRRPVPRRPSVKARRGTAFHAWIEQYFGAASLVDIDELPGADDDSTEDADLAVLQQTFLASPWAGREPVAVEVDVETPVADTVLRCRIDAVFRDEDLPGAPPAPAVGTGTAGDRFVVVDWKTGRPPADPQVSAQRQVQLAAYRLAWSRYTGVPLANVRAAFYFASTGETLFAEELLDEPAIEALLAVDPPQDAAPPQ